MGANGANALFFLVTTLFNLVIWIFGLRLLLQAVRADFYNPISQFIWQVTRFPTDALRQVLPNYRQLNVAAAVTLVALALLYIYAVSGLLGMRVGLIAALWFSVLKLVVMGLGLFTFTLFVQAVMSWLGPGVHNPAANILWSLNEPLLRPVRRLIPPIGGLDLSPLAVILMLQVLSRLVPLPGVLR